MSTVLHSLSNSASDKDFLAAVMGRINHNNAIINDTSAPPIAESIENQGERHRIFLRLAWLLLSHYSRREALPMLFHLARTFSPGPVSGYHESLTYFWINTVHFVLISDQEKAKKESVNVVMDFKTFLERYPHLVDEQFVFTFYSRDLLMTEKARDCVVLPNLQPMPCIVSYSTSSSSSGGGNVSDGVLKGEEVDSVRERLMPRLHTLSDSEFYRLACEKRLPCWGHNVKLRLIYCLLMIHGRQRGGVDEVLQAVKAIEQSGFNVTVTYFWIQLTTYHMMKVFQQLGGKEEDRIIFGKLFPSPTASSSTCASFIEVETVFERSMSFDEFIRYDINEDLTTAQLIEKYYPKETLLTLNDQYVTLPTIKPLPNIIVN